MARCPGTQLMKPRRQPGCEPRAPSATTGAAPAPAPVVKVDSSEDTSNLKVKMDGGTLKIEGTVDLPDQSIGVNPAKTEWVPSPPITP